MKVLAVGFKDYQVLDLKSNLFDRLKLKVNLSSYLRKDCAQEFVNSGKTIDLLLLGGELPWKEIPAESADYKGALNFARANPNMPSIILVYPVLSGVIEDFQRHHPPNLTIPFNYIEDVLDLPALEKISKRYNFKLSHSARKIMVVS